MIQNPLYDKVEIIPNEKVTLYEKNDKTTFTSYNLYDVEIEKRLFYLNNKLLALDLRQKDEPKFRENVNTLLHDIKSQFIISGKISFFFLSPLMLSIFPYSINLKKLKELYLQEYEKNKTKENIY